MIDLLQRARLMADWQRRVHGFRDKQLIANADLMVELADEVERLRSENAKARELLGEVLQYVIPHVFACGTCDVPITREWYYKSRELLNDERTNEVDG